MYDNNNTRTSPSVINMYPYMIGVWILQSSYSLYSGYSLWKGRQVWLICMSQQLFTLLVLVPVGACCRNCPLHLTAHPFLAESVFMNKKPVMYFNKLVKAMEIWLVGLMEYCYSHCKPIWNQCQIDLKLMTLLIVAPVIHMHH